MRPYGCHSSPRAFANASRYASTEAAAASSSAPAPPLSTDPKLNKIVDDISGLTLLQAADLVTLLKVRILSFIPMCRLADPCVTRPRVHSHG